MIHGAISFRLVLKWHATTVTVPPNGTEEGAPLTQPIKPVRAVERSLEILHLFLARAQPLGAGEVARATDLPKSTAYRLLLTMEAEGYLARTEAEKFCRGPRLIGALLQQEGPDLRTLAQSVIADLRDVCGETAGFHLLEGSERRCILAAEGNRTLRTSGRVGSRAPLYSGASARAILAFLPTERQEAFLDQGSLKPITPRTITDPERLRAELARIRADGYAVSDGEWEEGIISIAAPVFGPAGAVMGSINLSGPSFRFPSERIEALVGALKAAALALSHRLGSG